MRPFKKMSSGANVDLLEPKADQIYFSDISMTMARTYRFGGQSIFDICLCQHSINVAALSDNDRMRKISLLHDMAEVYLGEVITPVKWLMEELSGVDIFAEMEKPFNELIFEIAGVDLPTEQEHEELKANDIAACLYEAGQGGIDTSEWGYEPLRIEQVKLIDSERWQGFKPEGRFNHVVEVYLPELFNWEGGK